jgi:hypothetical protein
MVSEPASIPIGWGDKRLKSFIKIYSAGIIKPTPNT